VCTYHWGWAKDHRTRDPDHNAFWVTDRIVFQIRKNKQKN